MPIFLWLAANPEVLLAGVFLLTWAVVQAAITKPHAESTGLTSILTAPLRLASQVFNTLVRFIISHIAASNLIPVTRFVNGLTALVRQYTRTQADLAESTAHGFERVTGVVVPRAAKTAAKPALRQAKVATTKAAHAQKTATSTSTALTHYRVRTDKKVAHATVAVDTTLPRSIGRIRQQEEALSRDQAKLKERTTSLENGAIKTWEWIRTHPLSGVTTAFAGAVAIALTRLGWGVLRCRSWQGLGRRLTCGMGNWLHSLLDLIATFALAVLAVLRPDVLAEATVAAVDDVESIFAEILNN